MACGALGELHLLHGPMHPLLHVLPNLQDALD